MRKVAFLIMLIFLLTACEGMAASSSEDSSAANVIASQAASEADSQTDPLYADGIVGGIAFNSLGDQENKVSYQEYMRIPERAPLVKDDAYYDNLLAQMDYSRIYSGATLEEKMLWIAGSYEICFLKEYDYDRLSNEGIGAFDTLIFAALGDMTSEEWPGENPEDIISYCFYKEEMIDQYVYSAFNIKLDYSKVTGYSPKQCGVWTAECGRGGGGRYPKMLELKKEQDGVYKAKIQFICEGDSNTPDEPMWDSIYTFTVKGERIIINKIEILKYYDEEYNWY